MKIMISQASAHICFVTQCSYSVCHRTRDENQRAVEAYVDAWRSRQSTDFFCYYDTDTKTKAIVEKFYGVSDVVHSMLWPSLIVLACSIAFLRLEMQRRGLTLCGRQTTSTPPARTLANGGSAGGELAPLQQTPSGSGISPSPRRDMECRLVGRTESERHLVYKSLPSLDGIRLEPYSSNRDRARNWWLRNAKTLSIDRYTPEET